MCSALQHRRRCASLHIVYLLSVHGRRRVDLVQDAQLEGLVVVVPGQAALGVRLANRLHVGDQPALDHDLVNALVGQLDSLGRVGGQLDGDSRAICLHLRLAAKVVAEHGKPRLHLRLAQAHEAEIHHLPRSQLAHVVRVQRLAQSCSGGRHSAQWSAHQRAERDFPRLVWVSGLAIQFRTPQPTSSSRTKRFTHRS